jgi:PAS domain S-box-containing protein
MQVAARDLSAWRDEGSSQLVRTLEDKIGVGTWMRRWDQQHFEWSPGFYKLLGLVPGSVQPSFTVINEKTHPADRQVVEELDRQLRETGTLNREYRIIRPDGRVRWLFSQAETIYKSDGTPDRIEAVVADITLLQETRRAQRLAEQRLKALSKVVDGIVFHAKETGEVIDATNIGPAIKVPSDQYIGHAWHQFIHPEDLWKVLEQLEYARSTKSAFEAEHRTRMPDGEYRWRLTRASPIFAPDHSIIEYIGVTIDIEGKKRHQEAKIADTGATTGAQMRGGRGILNWSVRDLSVAADISVATIRRLEEHDGPTLDALGAGEAIRAALEKAGVEFFAQPNCKPGVRPR